MLSRDKCLPLDTWNTSGLQENVIGNQTSFFDSSRDHPQKDQFHKAIWTGTFFTRDDK